MKILLVSPLPPPVGGISSWTVNLLNYLYNEADGYEILHQDTALKYKRITQDDILRRIFFGLIESKEIIDNLKINIKKHNPDVIHLTSSASLALMKDYFLIKLAKKHKIPVIIHWRFGRIPELADAQNWEWKILGRIIRKSHTSIVLDTLSYNTLLNAGFNNVEKIPNPIGLEVEQRIKKELENPSQRHPGRLIFAGHVIKNKGVYELVEACSRLPIIKELFIIGPYEDNVKKDLLMLASERDKGDWLKFLGTIAKDEVLKLMSSSRIFVLPSYTEGFPNVVIEAMAMGCAVIATPVGAIPEILGISTSKPCGICVPVKNPEKLREAIFELVLDPHRAEALGRDGIERVLNNYTLENIVKKYRATWVNAG
jgi:glycosyltransferase involved in cell wall biosynthesis